MQYAMNKKIGKLVISLALGKISKQEFLNHYPIIEHDPEHVTKLLQEAYFDKNADHVEYALILGSIFGFPENCLDALCQLLDTSFHYKHEDIVWTLQELQDPRSIDCLYRASKVRHKYLEYNDSTSLAVKCVWALFKIGTYTAKEKLRAIAETDDREEVRKTARERLDKYQMD